MELDSVSGLDSTRLGLVRLDRHDMPYRWYDGAGLWGGQDVGSRRASWMTQIFIAFQRSCRVDMEQN